MSLHVLICENSIDGILSGIYRAYESRYGHSSIELTTADRLDTYNLFCEYEEVPVDIQKVQKVSRTLLREFGQEGFRTLCEAMSAWESPRDCQKEMSKANAVYKTVALGLARKEGARVLNYLGESYVNRVFQLSRSTYCESHHLLGFLRFAELENGVLFSQVHPKNYVLPLLADHFCDRLPQENFIIYDDTHKTAAFHKAGASYLLAEVPEADRKFMERYSAKEKEYRALWLEFFRSIAIEARKNPKLQSGNMPKRFWPDILEMAP